jgi:hypothetical protein
MEPLFLIFSGNSARIAANAGVVQLELSHMLREAGASLLVHLDLKICDKIRNVVSTGS